MRKVYAKPDRKAREAQFHRWFADAVDLELAISDPVISRKLGELRVRAKAMFDEDTKSLYPYTWDKSS